MFTRDFISGEMKYFQFCVWSIFYSCLLEIPRNETHCVLFWITVCSNEILQNELLKKTHCFRWKLRSSEQFQHRLVLTKNACVTFKFTVSSLCFMYSVGVCCTYLHVARIIADYLFRYSEAEAFRYITRLLLKVFLLLVFKKMCFLPAIALFP